MSRPVILFDLGGVLIDWNPRYLYRKLFDGDDRAMERFLAEVCTGAWNLELDRGRLFEDALAPLIRNHPEQRSLIEAYRDRWVEMIAGSIDSTVAVLDELHACGHRLAALTNWSAETLPLVRNDPNYAFFNHFEQIFVSGDLRMIKPDPAIFRHAIDKLGVAPAQIFFIDDNAANAQAAEAVGMQALRFVDAALLRDWLVDHDLLD